MVQSRDFLFALLFLQLGLAFSAGIPSIKLAKINPETFHLRAHFDNEKLFQLVKVKGDSPLTKNIQIIQNNGEQAPSIWSPSPDEIEQAQADLYIDPVNKAVLKIQEINGGHIFEGIVGDHTIQHLNGAPSFKKNPGPQTDFLKYNLDGYYNKTPKVSNIAAADNPNIVELLIVCDKEFGDVFGHDRQKILNYWTVYMWDVNLRYKSLPSVNLQFHIVGLVVAATPQAQSYIEESRGPDGKVNHNRILDKFSSWIYTQSVQGSVPKFDMAISVSNAEQEWGGGLAWMHGACRVDTGRGYNLNTLSFNDGGNWGSATVGAHEMGHNVGAPHDDDENFPGGCPERGYIMGGGTDDLRWFFSSCSDREVTAFVTSATADCLRTIESTPILDPNLNDPKAPSRLEQCKIHTGDSEAWMEPGDELNCKSIRCVYGFHDGAWWIQNIAPIDNTECGNNQRCFRGECRSGGYLLRNVGANLCLAQTNEFTYSSNFQIVSCPSVGTPLERVVMREGSTGTTLAMPFVQGSQSAGNHEEGDKCAYSGISEEEAAGIATDRCGEYTNPWHGFDLVDVGNSQFILKHKMTNRCIKPEAKTPGSPVLAYNSCDNNNPDFRWTRSL